MPQSEKNKPVNDSALKWLLRFWGLAALFYWIDKSQWFNSHVISYYARLSAHLTAGLLVLLGVEHSLRGTALSVGGQTFVIADSCTGSFVFLLLMAVVIAFPASWKEKAWGVFLGFLTVFGLNQLRSLMIVVLASRFATTFWGLHIIAGQALMITGTVAFFIFWSNTVGKNGFRFALAGRPLFRLLALYVGGFIFSYLLYSLFLHSPVGSWFKEMVIHHAATILGFLTETSCRGDVIITARNSIRVIHSCLSSPVLVLVLAAVFTLPISITRRAATYILIFFPLYYFYHLLRTIFAIWFMAGNRDSNIAYNFFGQFMLVQVLLLYFLYYWIFIRKQLRPAKGLAWLALSAIAALPFVWMDDFFWRSTGRPGILSIFNAGQFYDPGMIITMMPLFHSFVWLVLCLATPIWNFRRKILFGLAGWLALSLFYAATLALIIGLQLAPHPWAIKMLIVFLPFAAYTLLIYRDNPKPPE